MIHLHDIQTNDLGIPKNQMEPLQCIDCGLMPYRESLDLQVDFHEKVSSGALPSVILLVQHPPVITLGLHKDHNQLLRTEKKLSDMGIDVVQIRRGGGTTAHNPGQLVVYPIVRLDEFGFHVAPFVHYLEHLAIDVLSKTGIEAERRNRYPGLWVHGRKIASVGVQVARGTSMHGIAINLYNDLGIFDHIVPCGITGVEMTSSEKEGGRKVPMQTLKDVIQSRRIDLLSEYGAKRGASR
ncbi:lipoyl(octanoyl) transferase LipB [Pleomorphochaeta sp. DL1XJH-081]|uniref:lipoyl(octanoyl) transferase LipB n=1 Tax=Pleomorphochaeta sp. DL1XJH-081 TaxID=3409690 RepID=UPI003BB4B21B